MRENWPLGMIIPLQDPTPFSPFSPREWERALMEISQSGYERVELAITDPARVDHETVFEGLRKAGLRLSSITTGQAAAIEGLSLSSTDVTVRRNSIERIQAHMKLAKDYDAVVIVGSLRGADGEDRLLVESLQECTAFDSEVHIALEPLNRYESKLVNRIDEALLVVEQVGASNLGLLADTFHANIEEVDIAEAFCRAGDHLFHVHIADSNRWVPGYGHLVFDNVWQALEEIEYSGAVVVESLPKPDVDKMLACVGDLRSS